MTLKKVIRQIHGGGRGDLSVAIGYNGLEKSLDSEEVYFQIAAAVGQIVRVGILPLYPSCL